MKNNKQYFALKVSGMSLRKEYPDKVFPFTYQGIELYCYLASIGQWNIIEVATGLPIAGSKFSKIDAMKQAREILNEKGVEKFIADTKLAQSALNQMNIYEAINE